MLADAVLADEDAVCAGQKLQLAGGVASCGPGGGAWQNSFEPQQICHPIGVHRHVGFEALTLARCLGRYGGDPGVSGLRVEHPALGGDGPEAKGLWLAEMASRIFR